MIPLQMGQISLLSGKCSGVVYRLNNDMFQSNLYFSYLTTKGDQCGIIRDEQLAALRFSQSSIFKIDGKYTAMLV